MPILDFFSFLSFTKGLPNKQIIFKPLEIPMIPFKGINKGIKKFQEPITFKFAERRDFPRGNQVRRSVS